MGCLVIGIPEDVTCHASAALAGIPVIHAAYGRGIPNDADHQCVMVPLRQWITWPSGLQLNRVIRKDERL